MWRLPWSHTLPCRCHWPLGWVWSPIRGSAAKRARGRRDPTFLRATAISGLLMATVRVVATLHGQRRGVLSAIVIGSDLLLGIGGLELARQFDRNNPAAWPPGFNPALAQRCPPMHRSRDLEEVLP
jgi:hypothetical protein